MKRMHLCWINHVGDTWLLLLRCSLCTTATLACYCWELHKDALYWLAYNYMVVYLTDSITHRIVDFDSICEQVSCIIYVAIAKRMHLCWMNHVGDTWLLPRVPCELLCHLLVAIGELRKGAPYWGEFSYMVYI